ncbi:hypothetical protein NQ317_001906 [Molorchus minor]|uniref:ZAD domain-containing protein n=1 Tax=Molorchus minor TaxID=1323400 RepID=A0ABQ9JFU3_9CUCU|nr:hypothetical protein NQ317_001906 [Molorchus minor]
MGKEGSDLLGRYASYNYDRSSQFRVLTFCDMHLSYLSFKTLTRTLDQPSKIPCHRCLNPECPSGNANPTLAIFVVDISSTFGIEYFDYFYSILPNTRAKCSPNPTYPYLIFFPYVNKMASLMTGNGGICRLCLQVHCNDFETIDHTTTAVILNILNLTMDVAISDEPVMCKHCSRSVKMAFDFKSTCLFTEELVMLFARDRQTSHFRLKDVYKEHKSLVTANDSVCRFCMTCSETSNFLYLDAMKDEGLVSQKMLDLYLPEIEPVASVAYLKWHHII